jgi:hypothetical protein
MMMAMVILVKPEGFFVSQAAPTMPWGKIKQRKTPRPVESNESSNATVEYPHNQTSHTEIY